ncbi:MAG: hypothetical protein M0027_14585 [Candidatus Dormibacteraeota bacterium]|nr:hypothetical protein [Candidatus Dormibacteraeota bacterium]
MAAVSTNYYLKLHIGKTYASQGGYRWIWDESALSRREFIDLMDRCELTVVDEYGDEHGADEVLRLVIEGSERQDSVRVPFS